MNVIVDTCIWSLALRSDSRNHVEIIREFQNLIVSHSVHIIGPIRQEILSGIRYQIQFNKLKDYLAYFSDLPILTEDYIRAAQFYNLCRSKGIQGSNTDFLICSMAARTQYPIFTIDKDFDWFSRHLPIVLYKVCKPYDSD